MLSNVEENISDQFNNVYERLACLLYWLLIGSVLKDRRAKIYDSIGKVVDKHGVISFEKFSDNTQTMRDKVIFADENAAFQYSLEFLCVGTIIKVVRSDLPEENSTLTIDVAEYFQQKES